MLESFESVVLGAVAGAVASFLLTPAIARRVNREAADDVLLGEILDELHLVRECLDRLSSIDSQRVARRYLDGWEHLRRAGVLGVQLSPVFETFRDRFGAWMWAEPDQELHARLVGVADGLITGDDALPTEPWPGEMRTQVVVYQNLLATLRGKSWHAYSARVQRWRVKRLYEMERRAEPENPLAE